MMVWGSPRKLVRLRTNGLTVGNRNQPYVRGFSVHWATNDRRVNHGPLFQEADRQHVSYDPVDAIGEDERRDRDKSFRRSCQTLLASRGSHSRESLRRLF